MKKLCFPTLVTFFSLVLSAIAQDGTFIVKNAYEDIVIRQGRLQARSMYNQVGTTIEYDDVTTVNYFPKRLGKSIVLFKIEDYFQLEQAGIQQVTTTINNENLVITFYVDITRSDDKTKCMLPKYKIQKVYVEILSVTLNDLALKKDEDTSDTTFGSMLEELRKMNIEWEAWKNKISMDETDEAIERYKKTMKKKPQPDQSDSL